MKINKKNIIAVSLILLGICFAFFSFVQRTEDSSLGLQKENEAYQSVTLENEAPPKKLETVTTIVAPKEKEPPVVENTLELYTTFIIEDKTFSVPFIEGESVFDVMTTAMKKDIFTFGGREFSGIGFFVDELNGKKAERGTNFILWVNGKKAVVGVSDYKLLKTDIISWTYENNY